MASLNLAQPTLESPGSSVFDLPIQTSGKNTQPSHSRPSIVVPELGPPDDLEPSPLSFVVISGGTGGNAICSAFGNDACYVLPISDDGGSSSEIIRVLGGPSIGDIRSRLVRLIPAAPPSSPLDAIRTLMAYRLPAHYCEQEAREAWRDIVEGRSSLWKGIPNDRKETVRGFLVYFESEILKRAHKNFTFVNGSIGNYFIAAAMRFFRSLPSAIFLFSSITNSQANILPVVVTNHVVTIAVELDNGEKLVGQCEISHPVSVETPVIEVSGADPWSPIEGPKRNVMFEQGAKDEYRSLNSRISRLFYINAYGNEILPSPNPDYISSLSSREVLVYSCGSLWTSIIPCLALRGVASAIARSPSLRSKILLLNSKNDRETEGYTAEDYIHAIIRTLNFNYSTTSYDGLGNANTTFPVSAYITDLVYLKGTSVPVDVDRITAMGVRCTETNTMSEDLSPEFSTDIVRTVIESLNLGN
ncbi:UPF0052-domain-containing protein [Mycena floridula]|nr:UPF0052-domain-containing protein [Mycena floridula]